MRFLTFFLYLLSKVITYAKLLNRAGANPQHTKHLLLPSLPNPDRGTFSQYGTNIIVGRLGSGRDQNGAYDPSPRPLGIVIYDQNSNVKVALTKEAVEKILK